MKLSVIIPTKDRAAILQRSVDCLLNAIQGFDAEIIVVNDSNNNLILNNIPKNILVINNQGSGAAAARNTGVKHSKGDLLLFMDDDIIVSKVNILRTLHLHETIKGSAFNFFWLYPSDLMAILPQSSFGRYILANKLFSNSYRINVNAAPGELVKVEGLTSQYFSILRSDFLLTSGYDESIPFAGVEDLILYKQLSKKGIEMYISPSDIIFQNEIDRISLLSLMERYRRGAITRRKASDAGHLDMGIIFHFTKKILYRILLPFKSLLYHIAMNIPNIKTLDALYFKLTNLLLGLSSYEGYNYVKNKP